MNLVNWSPFRDMEGFFDRYNNLMAQRARTGGEAGKGVDWRPIVDISETTADYLIKVEVPGMTEDDTTLGGYLRVHDRPPAYEGSDGHPYTVSLETEKTSNLAAPFAGYLVFPRWAQNGVGIIGHVETPTLVEGASTDAAEEALGALTLHEVQALLEDAIERRRGAEDG